MLRTLLAASILSTALAPALAVARSIPEPKLHCSVCLPRIVAGGPSAPSKPGANTNSRYAPLVVVQFGGAQESRRGRWQAPATPAGEAVASPARPCTKDCCRLRA